VWEPFPQVEYRRLPKCIDAGAYKLLAEGAEKYDLGFGLRFEARYRASFSTSFRRDEAAVFLL
jgi:hypothetical protein